MAYTKTNWVNGVTALSKDNMNKIENGIEAAHTAIDTIDTSITDIMKSAVLSPITFFGSGTSGVYMGQESLPTITGYTPIGCAVTSVTYASGKTGSVLAGVNKGKNYAEVHALYDCPQSVTVTVYYMKSSLITASAEE